MQEAKMSSALLNPTEWESKLALIGPKASPIYLNNY